MIRSDAMINPQIVNLLKKTGTRYSLVISTSRRARQLIAGDEKLIDTKIAKPLTVAINELKQDAVIIEKQGEE